MANANSPRGFTPVRHTNGSPFNGQVKEYEFASGNGNSAFVGDLVKIITDSDTTDGTPLCDIAGASDTPVGVIVGIKPIFNKLDQVYKPASTQCKVLVADSPDVVFQIQSSGTLAHADVGKFARMTASTSGSTTTGYSGMQLDETTVTGSADSTHPLMLISIKRSADNAFGANGVAEVILINHAYRTGSGS